jgi:hypothetical protein
MFTENDERCCGTCRYHTREDISGDYVCGCDGSEYFSDWTDYNDICDEWEGKEDT